MGSVNVNRNVTDIFYRYKMPRISAKVEGKGNGIKTVIVNMAEVAKALGRPATYPTKYFGCELGAQTQFDHKNERFIVNGSHNAAKLQDLLDGFIRKYVLCPECDNPETDLLVSTKKGTISQGCKACGFHGPLEVHHKVNTFIIKNPPNLDPAAQGSSLTEGKRSKRSTKKGGENGNDTTENVAGDILITTPIVTAVVTAGGTIATATAVMPSIDSLDTVKTPIITPTVTVTQDDDDDTTWSADISAEAVRARMQDLTDGAKTMTISDDNDKPEKERLDIFYELVKKRRDGGELENVQVHKELAMEADRLDISQKAPLVLAELLFGQNIILEVRKHRNLFLRFTHNNAKAQRYLMGGLEQIIALHSAKLLDKVGGILKLFYDNDILEEKAILDWSSKVSKKYVAKEISEKIHEKATPFILWLQEAEEEESTSDEDDSDVEIKYDDRVRASDGLKKEQPPMDNSKTIRNKKDAGGDDEGDEIDIDDI